MESGVRPIAFFTLAYLVCAALIAWSTANWEFVYYISGLVVIIAFIVRVYTVAHFSVGTLWGLSIWGLLHMIGGLASVPDGWPIAGKPVFYSLWLIPEYLKYDQVVHGFGFGVATYACWQVLHNALNVKHATFIAVIMATVAGMGLGAINEVLEFFAVLLIPDTNVGGYVNTGWDLVSNMVGCTIAGLYIYYYYGRARWA
jgi:hypothetical protein